MKFRCSVSTTVFDHRPSADFFFLNSDGLKPFRLIFGLDEIYAENRQNSVNLRLNVNNCGSNSAKKDITGVYNMGNFLLVQLSLNRFTLIKGT